MQPAGQNAGRGPQASNQHSRCIVWFPFNQKIPVFLPLSNIIQITSDRLLTEYAIKRKFPYAPLCIKKERPVILTASHIKVSLTILLL